MPVESALYSLLSNSAAVAAVVSTRIYPSVAPQGAVLPFAVYRRESTNHLEVLAGSAGTARAAFEITAWSTSYDTSRDLAEKIRLALQGYSGTAASVVVEWINLTQDFDNYTPPQTAEEPGLHGVNAEYAFWFTEAVPTP